MRRISIKGFREDVRDERGASAVIVALLMVALLGFAAITIDVGKLYWEKAQLQNGADTAAISIANACATNVLDTACASPVTTAQNLANSSANDGNSAVDSAVANTLTGTVTVTTAASETGASAGSVSLWFARILGFNESAVNAKAIATWGSPTGGPGLFPLSFSECALHEFVQQNLTTSGAGWLKYKDDSPTCGSIYHAANIVPGGWGFLDPTQDDASTQDCALDITIGQYYDGSSGNSIPNPKAQCKAVLSEWAAEIAAAPSGQKYTTAYFPVFSKAEGNGGGTYLIEGIAAFRISAWKFSGNGTPDVYPASLPSGCTGNCRGIYGEFIRMVDPGELTGGGGTDMGVNTVRLTE